MLCAGKATSRGTPSSRVRRKVGACPDPKFRRATGCRDFQIASTIENGARVARNVELPELHALVFSPAGGRKWDWLRDRSRTRRLDRDDTRVQVAIRKVEAQISKIDGADC